MNSKENSTTAAGGATITCVCDAVLIGKISHDIDSKGGLIGKAQAAKNLSELLMNKLEDMIGYGKGKPGDSDKSRVFTFYESNLENLTWLMAEVWEVNQDLAEMIDRLDADIAPLCNIAYEARNAVQKRAAA